MTTPLEQIKERLEKLRRRYVTEPAKYKGSDANVYREGCNNTLDEVITLLPSIIQEVVTELAEDVRDKGHLTANEAIDDIIVRLLSLKEESK